MPEKQRNVATAGQSDAAAANELSFDAHKDIGDCFLRLTALPTFPLDRLSRYEHLLWRQARQIMLTLELFRRRMPQPRRSVFRSRSGGVSPVPCKTFNAVPNELPTRLVRDHSKARFW